MCSEDFGSGLHIVDRFSVGIASGHPHLIPQQLHTLPEPDAPPVLPWVPGGKAGLGMSRLSTGSRFVLRRAPFLVCGSDRASFDQVNISFRPFKVLLFF